MDVLMNLADVRTTADLIETAEARLGMSIAGEETKRAIIVVN